MAFVFVAQVGLIAWLAARFGLVRINLELALLVLVELSTFSALLVHAGWLILRGKWRSAAAAIALAVGVGFGLDRTIGTARRGDGPNQFLHRIVKPN